MPFRCGRACPRRFRAHRDGAGAARFALGAIQFLQAIERLGQAFYRYGLNNGEQTAALSGFPFLRLPIPLNPSPEPIDYEKLRAEIRSALEAGEICGNRLHPPPTSLTIAVSIGCGN